VRKLTSLFLLLAVALAPVPSSAAASVAAAREMMDAIGKQALAVIKSEGSKKQKQTKLEKIFSGNVDIEWVGRFVLGLHWRTATPEQRKRYLKEYEGFLVSHYAGRFAEYTGGSYTILSAVEDEPGQFIVSMKMLSPDNQEVLVDYRLHNTGTGKLQIFDVVVEGVSLITTQRSEFASVVDGKGLDYLTAQLAKRTLEVLAPGGKPAP